MLESFTCGEQEIDKWLRKHALQKHSGYKARVCTFAEVPGSPILGFYSLRIVLEQERELRKTFDVAGWANKGSFPALHLEYLAVRKSHHGVGLGRFMMAEVQEKFCEVAELTGVPMLTLRPLNEALVPYYKDRGFVPYGRNGSMMLDARKALRARAEAQAVLEAANGNGEEATSITTVA